MARQKILWYNILPKNVSSSSITLAKKVPMWECIWNLIVIVQTVVIPLSRFLQCPNKRTTQFTNAQSKQNQWTCKVSVSSRSKSKGQIATTESIHGGAFGFQQEICAGITNMQYNANIQCLNKHIITSLDRITIYIRPTTEAGSLNHFTTYRVTLNIRNSLMARRMLIPKELST